MARKLATLASQPRRAAGRVVLCWSIPRGPAAGALRVRVEEASGQWCGVPPVPTRPQTPGSAPLGQNQGKSPREKSHAVVVSWQCHYQWLRVEQPEDGPRCCCRREPRDLLESTAGRMEKLADVGRSDPSSSGLNDHATVLERADASVSCTGLSVQRSVNCR